MSIRKPVAAMAFALVLAACAEAPKNVSAFNAQSGKVSSVDIVLAEPAFAVTGGAKAALESEGWADGSMERKFCGDLVTRLGAAGVRARCYRSMWGARVFSDSTPPAATYILRIHPMRIAYAVETRYGVVSKPGFNPRIETTTSLAESRTGTQVWSGDIPAIFAPVDPTGARRYADSLLDALRSSHAL
jgi:hypothetical protein